MKMPLYKNISFLKSLGYHFIEPESGRLACGTIGKGKLADTETIIDYIDMLLYKNKDLSGKKVLVTAGPTREDIDPVRYITNRSTGKMGYAVAKAARDRGADVILISGPVNIKAPNGIKLINVYSAQEMYNAVIENFNDVDILIKSAAVADYKPANKSDIKIKKSDDDLYITLSRNKDILYEIGKIKKNQIVVGFAAETNDLIDNAKAKIQKKNLDYIVANDVTLNQSGFGSENNTVKIIDKYGNIKEYPNMPKEQVANEIFNIILKNER